MIRYSASQRYLHWLFLILLVLAYITIEFRSEFERGTPGRVFMVRELP